MNGRPDGSPPERAATTDVSDQSLGSAISPHPAWSPPGQRVPLLELQPGERVQLPLADDEGVRGWTEPVTITSVLLIDSGLVQVRWEPETEEGRWAAHLLLSGPAYAAGAIRAH